jgi:hypothetical protein
MQGGLMPPRVVNATLCLILLVPVRFFLSTNPDDVFALVGRATQAVDPESRALSATPATYLGMAPERRGNLVTGAYNYQLYVSLGRTLKNCFSLILLLGTVQRIGMYTPGDYYCRNRGRTGPCH